MRVLGNQQLELRNELGARTEREIRLDPLLKGFDVQLLEPEDLGLRPCCGRELDQRASAPKRERLPQKPVRLDRVGTARIPN